MGWNSIIFKNKNNLLLEGLDGADMFFAHSYVMECPKIYVEATAEYGSEFSVIVRAGNIYGIQCHPEKSSVAGKIFLEKFINLR
jgi:glutamine amidotransferase